MRATYILEPPKRMFIDATSKLKEVVDYYYCSQCRKKLNQAGDYIKPIEYHF